MALLAVAFVDELSSGVAPASTPEIAHDLGISPGAGAGAMLFAFYAFALLLEPPLLVWSERITVRRFSSVSLGAVALASLAAAVAPGPWTLLLALACYGPAVGCALASAEGALVEADPTQRERALARLGIAASLGDLTVPALLALLAFAGLGWRSAFGVSAVVAAVLAVVHARSAALDHRPGAGHDDDDDDDDEADVPIGEAFRTAWRARGLRWWSLATMSTGLLDEILVAFAMTHLAALGASSRVRALALAVWTLGGLVSLAAVDRWIARFDTRRVLQAFCAISAVALGALARTHSPLVATGAMAVLGLASAPLHPLTRARAYASLPGRPALVNAVASLLAPLEAAAPLVLAAIATVYGVPASVAALIVAPAAVALAARFVREPP